MVEAAGQEVVLKIFKKATWCLVGAGSCDPRRQEWGEWGECRALQLLLYTCTLGWYFEVWQFDLPG